ncbi:MAG TPA: hypothetical protein VNG12_25810 [Acidimicrobiales bacterium]|nr:hypothetical protein [Acidimicrobiales bacterium]HVA10149.1 hypothetical protein [Acidimicrobiales bacterium]
MNPKRRLFVALATAGGVMVGGGTALVEAPGSGVSLAGVTAKAPAASAIDPQIAALRAEEQTLQAAIAGAEQRLAAEVAQQSQQQDSLSQQAAQLAAERATLAQESAQFAAAQRAAAQQSAPATHASTGASGALSGDDGGGDG